MMSNPEITTSAYDLLSKPTLEITDDEALLIVEDLRKRRNAYVSKNVKDNPHKAKPAANPLSKAQATAAIAASMNLDFDL